MKLDDECHLYFSLVDAALSKIRERAGTELWSEFQYESAGRIFDKEMNEWTDKNGIAHPQLQDAIDSILASIFSMMEV
jgi:hypothetical protein